MDSERLVEVYLVPEALAAIDQALETHPELYRDRSAVVIDGLRRLGFEPTIGTADRARDSSGSPMRVDPEKALAIRAPAPDAHVSRNAPTPPDEPTIGIHNRDWPTLWAASHLGQREGPDPPLFATWIVEITDEAWKIANIFGADRLYDLTGLPSPDKKSGANKKSAETRFKTHFVSDRRHRGPLFGLGLAYLDEDSRVVSLTSAGAALLTALDGYLPMAKEQVRPEWRHAFLSHLARHVPSDFALLALIVRAIAAGTREREPLNDLVEQEMISEADEETRKRWQKKDGGKASMVTSTNVSGFISRGREWGLILPKQKQRRYLLTDDALDALAEAERAAAG
jgi:hypothetical protein